MAGRREWLAGALTALIFGSPACGSAKSEQPGPVARGGASGSAGASGGKSGAAGHAGGAGTGTGGAAGTAGGKAGAAGTAGSTDPGSGGDGGEDANGTGGSGKGGGAGASSGGAGTTGAGTGGDGGEGGAMDESPLSPLIDAFCAAARSCCAIAGEPAGALEACENQAAAANGNVALAAGGTVDIDAAALAACVAAFEAAATECVLTDVLTACRGILRGTLGDGDACSDVMECDRSAGPMVCRKLQMGTADPDIGVCTPPPRGTLGDACASSCEDGQECSTTSSSPDDAYPTAFCFEADGLYCVQGESCAAIVPDGDECTYNEACGSDGFCVSSCESLAGPAEMCQFNYGCQAGLACVEGKCAPEPFANSYTCVGHPPSFN
jgi:hypothetical protein